MSTDMSDMMNQVNSMLQNGAIPDNVKEALNQFSSKNAESTSTSSSTSSDANNEAEEKGKTDTASLDPEMIRQMMGLFSQFSGSSKQSGSSSSGNSSDSSSPFNLDMETILKMKTIFEKLNHNEDDPRSNLLLSLKPYLKESRKEKVEQYVKLLNMGKVMEVFNPKDGENSK